MSRKHDLAGVLALLLLAGLAPRMPVAAPAPPPRPRVLRGKPDAPVAQQETVTDWTLVQVAPRFAVLATGPSFDRLKAELDVLAELHTESREQEVYFWQLRPTNRLFA